MGQEIKRMGVKTIVLSYTWPTIESESQSDMWFRSIGLVYSLLKKEMPSVVITNTIVIPWFAFCAVKLGIPHLWFIRELINEDSQLYLFPNKTKYLDLISRSDSIFTNSNTMKKIIGESIHKKIKVLYPTIKDDPVFHQDSKSKFALKHPKLLVLGSLCENKNQLEAIKAVRILKQEGVESILTIVGSPVKGKYYDKLQLYIERYNLKDNVVIKPFSKKPFQILQSQDALIVPSKFEPFGRVTVEAMLTGIPVIVSNEGGSTEIIQNGKYGYVYEGGRPKDLAGKILEIYSQPQIRARKIETARKYARRKFLESNNLNLITDEIQLLVKKQIKPEKTTWIDDYIFSNSGELFKKLEDQNRKEMSRLTTENTTLKKDIHVLTNTLSWKSLALPRKYYYKIRFRPKDTEKSSFNRPIHTLKSKYSYMIDHKKYCGNKNVSNKFNNLVWYQKNTGNDWKMGQNFGDYLSLIIMDKLLSNYGLKRIKDPNIRLLTVGSILHFAKNGDVIWGSGINGKVPTNENKYNNLDVRMVRGPLTRRHLQKLGIDAPEIYGDPALLLPTLFPKLRYRPKKNKVIAIPNLNELSSISLTSDNVNVISPLLHYKIILNQILSSELVVASSLHGIIVAEAFGVPVRFVMPAGGETIHKYQDYFEGTGRVLPAANETFLNSVSKDTGVPIYEKPKFNASAMLSLFPIDIFETK